MIRRACCFLRKAASPAQILAALGGYAPLQGCTFREGEEPGTFEASVPGLRILVTSIARLKPLMAEANGVGRRLTELRASSMVLTVDYALDAGAYSGTLFEPTSAPFTSPSDPSAGGGACPGEVVATCEALNINLAAHLPITYDVALGFYPNP